MTSSEDKPRAAAKKKGTKRGDDSQSALFIQKAREIGADEEKSAADDLIRRLAKTPHEPRKPTKRK